MRPHIAWEEKILDTSFMNKRIRDACGDSMVVLIVMSNSYFGI